MGYPQPPRFADEVFVNCRAAIQSTVRIRYRETRNGGAASAYDGLSSPRNPSLPLCT
jgi:hypothetical protein